jgi:predicted secreted Zn-dependent protease
MLLSGVAGADLTEQLDYSYYDVPVHKGQSLRELLNAASPVRSEGRTFHAYTKWNVNWHYQSKGLPSGRCGVDSVHTVLTATMTLPRPSDPAIARDPAFIAYLAALTRHEQGHLAIGRSAALAIDQGVLVLPSQDTCAAIDTVAHAFVDEQIGNARVAEARYDRDTGNGRTQGARLD